jgi:short-subunit dehydrogenase
MTTTTAFDPRSHYGGWALVAGASAGLGAAFAHESARLGFDVVLLARRAEVLAETASTIRETYGVRTRCIVADLAQDDIGDVVATETGDLDIGVMIYNAAAEIYGPFTSMSDADHRTNLAVNCFAPSVLSRQFGLRMRDRGRGAIAIVSSLAALQGTRYLAIYGASKAYELNLAEAMWEEFGDFGVDVLSYVVGATVSESWIGAADGAFVDTPDLPPLQRRILQPATAADVATRCFTVLRDGPRQYSTLIDETTSQELATWPRDRVVRAQADITIGLARFAHLPKPPRLGEGAEAQTSSTD